MLEQDIAAHVASRRKAFDKAILWRKVLAQAVKDAAGTAANRRIEIAQWVQTPAFLRVCADAQVKAGNMHQAIKDVLLAEGVRRRVLAQRVVQALGVENVVETT